MSIAIGIYDLFAYTIPGFLYIYVLYVFLLQFDEFKTEQFIPTTIPEGYGLLLFTLILVSAHLLGHLLDNPAHWFTYRFSQTPYEFSEKALERSKKLYADLDIHFQPKDRGILFSMLRQRNLEHAHTIDSYEANSIMLRNVSLGLFLLAGLKVYSLFEIFSLPTLILAMGLLALSYVARKRSHMFHSWFWTDIFESSLRYGNTLKEVVTYEQPDRRISADTRTKKQQGKTLSKND
jgi:hypothetical protein